MNKEKDTLIIAAKIWLRKEGMPHNYLFTDSACSLKTPENSLVSLKRLSKRENVFAFFPGTFPKVSWKLLIYKRITFKKLFSFRNSKIKITENTDKNGWCKCVRHKEEYYSKENERTRMRFVTMVPSQHAPPHSGNMPAYFLGKKY